LAIRTLTVSPLDQGWGVGAGRSQSQICSDLLDNFAPLVTAAHREAQGPTRNGDRPRPEQADAESLHGVYVPVVRDDLATASGLLQLREPQREGQSRAGTELAMPRAATLGRAPRARSSPRPDKWVVAPPDI